MKQLLLLGVALFAAMNTYGQFAFTVPEIDGTIRAKYEYQPTTHSQRFQVRNARFSLTGKVHPMIGYKAEIDLSDEGKIRMLDAYIGIDPLQQLDFRIGQMRVPFTIDAHRSPHQQYFANRSFIAKQVGNVRDVGAAVKYDFSKTFPLVLQAGIFNGSGITEQKEWHKKMNYSAKAEYTALQGLNLTLSAQTTQPDEIRIYMYDIGMFYEFAGFHVEGEYLFKKYAKGTFQHVNAFNSFINYDLKLKKVFSKISFLARFDCMGDHSNGLPDEHGKLIINDAARKRLTGGITLSLGKPFTADIRLNYEKYFYNDSSLAKESEQDKLVVEVVARF